ncbi:hypothetical protein [Streptomyces cyaneus]|uniref:hypothetical protein n=1 Tax=Streptomyces cyaneus TaxID=1904 RepID=UPI000FF89180|nr:hypothetical protein [Streptomyces cyaneus]
MTTRFDDDADGTELSPDDPLAVILRPSSDYLAPPAGSYRAIRRRASRRRLVRTAIGAGVTCAVAVLVALPLQLGTSEGPTSPAPPLAPPPASNRTTPPAPSAIPTPSASSPRSASPTPTVPSESATSEPTANPRTDESRTPSSPAVPTSAPSTTPTFPRAQEG